MNGSPTARDRRCVAADRSGIARAADALSSGRLIAFPTETVYGLGADAGDDNAVAAIFEAKGRPRFNPLIVHVAGLQAARQLADFNRNADQLAEAFWPGALTMVLRRKQTAPLSLLVSVGLDTVAIRFPQHATAQAIIETAGVPVAAPSANRSGHVSPTTANHVCEAWEPGSKVGPDVIVDDGPCRIGLESTVIDLSEATPVLLRPGGLPIEDLAAVLGAAVLGEDIRSERSAVAPKSPGMLLRHYAPATPLRMNADRAGAGGLMLGFGPACPGADVNLSPDGDLREAAANLFAMLHRLDALGGTEIAVSPVPETGLGRAINDRLRRAAE